MQSSDDGGRERAVFMVGTLVVLGGFGAVGGHPLWWAPLVLAGILLLLIRLFG